MKTFKEIIGEASVGKNSLPIASKKVIDFLSRSLGMEFKPVTGQEYSNSSGTYFGFLFVSDEGPAIRVNWDGNEFHSINYWDDYVEEMNPTMEIFTKNMGPSDRSFVKILPEIASAIVGSGVNTTTEEVDESRMVEETMQYNGKIVKNMAELVRAMYDNGEDLNSIKRETGYPPGHIRKLIAKYTGNDQETQDDEANNATGSGKVRIIGGSAETIVPSKRTRKADDFLEETEYADPDVVFKELDDYLELIMRGYIPALLITGQGGIGKSYNVEQALKKFGKVRHDDFEIVKGRSSAAAMYRTLWQNRDKIVIFDDCDSVFDDKDGLNILKGALDSGKVREISWMTKADGMVDTRECDSNKECMEKIEEWSLLHNGNEGTPTHFFFEGQVIFISNRTRAQIYKADRALPSRCTCVDIVLTAESVVKRIETCLPHIKIYKAISKNSEQDITDENLKKEVFAWISSDAFLKDPKRRGKEINFRTFNQIYQYRHAGLERWKELSFRAG